MERKLEIFIDNQNQLAKMVATNYLMLKALANKAGIEELPKPLIDMSIEEDTVEVK